MQSPSSFAHAGCAGDEAPGPGVARSTRDPISERALMVLSDAQGADHDV